MRSKGEYCFTGGSSESAYSGVLKFWCLELWMANLVDSHPVV